ncbi:flippase-like domain-containing protein [Streptomyces sp. TRM66268-LWL]|uniref:Flippase-like domain-containing protein n=1 Tax=Streptomyces polyasparticus TaxID=2767826 RepID=A0ABR7SC50_9ACTN|nr:lysylphosphatidylglycerol synthase transmembrane domain-containing protein [Streptomyces polyasparticus]MBC9713062.1 flippase-like domain-containing protein [Streptomyces polyasparticus]
MSPLRLEELPAPGPASPALRLKRLPFGGRQVRLILSVLPLLFIGTWAALDWDAVRDGTARLASADPGLLFLAVVFTGLCSVSASFIRQGAIPERLPPGRLLASQFAAGAANHVLPAGLGAHAVTLRFLQARGIPLARATASLALYSLVKPVAKFALILVFLVAFPDTLPVRELLPTGETFLIIAGCAAGALVTVALVLKFVHPLRRPLMTFLGTALTDARLLHSRPSRVLALWGGAAALPLFQAATLAAVAASLGVPLPWTHVIFAHLAASAMVGAVPAPGGIGPVDAAMVFTLVVFGTPMALATATVIGYRVISGWLPLLPGALALSVLVRKKVL